MDARIADLIDRLDRKLKYPVIHPSAEWTRLGAEAMIVLAEAGSALSARGDSTGWLIEAKHNEYTMWWRSGDCGSNYGEPNWTLDAFRAVRFVRQEDAQTVIDSWPVWAKHEFKATDHLFMQTSYVGEKK